VIEMPIATEEVMGAAPSRSRHHRATRPAGNFRRPVAGRKENGPVPR